MKRTFVDVLRAGVLSGAIISTVGVAQGADVDAYSVQKGSIYSQTSAAAPGAFAESPFLFRAVAEGDVFGALTEASVSTPLGAQMVLELDENASVLLSETALPTLSTLNTMAPNGTYTFTFDTENDGLSIAQLSLSGGTFPTAIPTISNYAAAQAVDPSADFTLNFNTFGNVEGTERWELSIIDDFGFEIYSDSGMGGSVTLPQGILFEDATHDARLRFVREVANDTTSYPGATGTIEIYNETRFSLVTGTGGGGGGGDDTTPPMLLFSNPVNGTQDVPVNTFITFVFSKSMEPTESIQWSANLNADSFVYNWEQGGMVLIATYPGGLPADATITWTLNPTAGGPDNFRDEAGNALPQTSGSFSTTAGGDPNDPCDPAADDGRGGGSIFKGLSFVQTGNSAPVPDPELAASASAFFRAGTNQVISGVSITGPNGTENLTSLFGNFFATEEFASAAALETAFPAGNYTITVTGTGGGSATLAIGSTSDVPVPQISNLSALSAMNVATDFTLNFAPFTGAGANDGIFISISGDEGQGEFMAPDPCVPRELPNTATSVVIPANTFKAGQTYRGIITFSRAGQDSSAIPNTTVVAGVSVQTSFEFTIGGGTTRQPMFSGIVWNPDGTLGYTIQADTGVTVSIQGSDRPDGGWTEVSSVVLATGSHQFTIDPKLSAKRFFRAVVL